MNANGEGGEDVGDREGMCAPSVWRVCYESGVGLVRLPCGVDTCYGARGGCVGGAPLHFVAHVAASLLRTDGPYSGFKLTWFDGRRRCRSRLQLLLITHSGSFDLVFMLAEFLAG